MRNRFGSVKAGGFACMRAAKGGAGGGCGVGGGGIE